jgi:hypothetical protein
MVRYGASVESTRAFETVSWSLTSALSPTIGLFMKGLAKPPFKFPDMLWPCAPPGQHISEDKRSDMTCDAEVPFQASVSNA